MIFIKSQFYILLLLIGFAWCHPAIDNRCKTRHNRPQITSTSSTYELLPSSTLGEKQEVTTSQVNKIAYPTQFYGIVSATTVTSSDSYSSLTTTIASTTSTIASTTATATSSVSSQIQPSYPDNDAPQSAILANRSGSNNEKNIQSNAIEILNTSQFTCSLIFGALIYYLL